MKVKSRAESEANYKAAIPSVAAKYSQGVQSATGVIEASKAGQALYVERMQNQDVLARRARGLEGVTDQDWKKAALEKGAARIGPGMQAGATKQQQNWEPCRQFLESTTLPPRTGDTRTNVMNRVVPIAEGMQRAVGKNV